MSGSAAMPGGGARTVPEVGTSRHGRGFWVCVAVGWAVIGYAAGGLLDTQTNDRIVNWLLFLVGLDLLHDGLIAPAVCGCGALMARFVPGRWRAPLQAGLLASAAILLVAAAPLRDTADIARNPTIQPLDYETAVLWALGIAWAAVFGVFGVSQWRRRARPASRQARSRNGG